LFYFNHVVNDVAISIIDLRNYLLQKTIYKSFIIG
jgi:hypothetical protein